MKYIYLVFGFLICFLMAYSGMKGYSFFDLLSSEKWGPAGKNSYHK